MAVTIYCGPYADLVGRSEHGGYEARVMPDGTLTDDLSEGGYDGHVGFRAACRCGWAGATVHSGDYDERGFYPGQFEARKEWDSEHLQPLIKAAERAWPA
jgi:hypothetical protein